MEEESGTVKLVSSSTVKKKAIRAQFNSIQCNAGIILYVHTPVLPKTRPARFGQRRRSLLSCWEVMIRMTPRTPGRDYYTDMDNGQGDEDR